MQCERAFVTSDLIPIVVSNFNLELWDLWPLTCVTECQVLLCGLKYTRVIPLTKYVRTASFRA